MSWRQQEGSGGGREVVCHGGSREVVGEVREVGCHGGSREVVGEVVR